MPVSLVPTTGSTTDGAGTGTSASAETEAPAPTRTRPAIITPPRTTEATRPATVTGRYHVLESYGDSFIGEVLLTNRTGTGQDWVVTLTYPGTLRTSWLESLPQPTLVQRGDTYTWTSSVPLAASSTGQLRFHFDRSGGSDNPDACSVNGQSCS
ncbi:cellulose binding domain-containing protein [Paractinoplanes globisporus]|uniref:Cellulose binding domain-containing protein n=1 Tax=Paractinoplanes globisporus TaxID=113565 RepID=A0ABW6WFW6_9ACTN|nr:cellulose binding domain-containing protein [Actinoplanes globisporus]